MAFQFDHRQLISSYRFTRNSSNWIYMLTTDKNLGIRVRTPVVEDIAVETKIELVEFESEMRTYSALHHVRIVHSILRRNITAGPHS